MNSVDVNKVWYEDLGTFGFLHYPQGVPVYPTGEKLKKMFEGCDSTRYANSRIDPRCFGTVVIQDGESEIHP